MYLATGDRTQLTATLLPPKLSLSPKTHNPGSLPLAGLSPAIPGVVYGTKCNRKGENATDQTGIQNRSTSEAHEFSRQVLYQLATGDRTWLTATHYYCLHLES